MENSKTDILLVGGGIMSATLGVLLQQLDPHLRITLVEQLPHVALESSHALNNAGTGHAGYCELNYTPALATGNVAIERALEINAAFEVSLQLWSYLVETQVLPAAQTFINPTPHISFVSGEADVNFLRQRYMQLCAQPLFADMEFSDDISTLQEWMPLVMQQRDKDQKVAATRVHYGSDVDFGALTQHLIQHLSRSKNFNLVLNTQVSGLKQNQHGHWHATLQSPSGNSSMDAGFVFLGAGGGALNLLQKSGIAEGQGYAGFPFSGQWLICDKPDIVAQHKSKVYGRAALGTPPMSTPHLDLRIINDKPTLLFGPFAGFSSKFLKQGSYWDLFKSIRPSNVKALWGVARHNLNLMYYLMCQTLQSHATRMKALRQFYPPAVAADWHLAIAGHRVQIIKPCPHQGGKLEFGTEIISAKDGTLAALLGASPGASVSVQAMLNIIDRCFSAQIKSVAWQNKLKEMIPSYGASLIDNADLLKQVRQKTLKTLQLK